MIVQLVSATIYGLVYVYIPCRILYSAYKTAQQTCQTAQTVANVVSKCICASTKIVKNTTQNEDRATEMRSESDQAFDMEN
jgi:hypothetical protein